MPFDIKIAFILIPVLILTACATTAKPVARYPAVSRDDLPGGRDNDIYARQESIFGPGGVLGAIHDTLHTKPLEY